MDRQAIIEKIQKLLALSRNAAATPAEAATAASLAQRLLLKYRLEMGEVEAKASPTIECRQVYQSSRVDGWIGTLGNAISSHFGCRVFIDHDGLVAAGDPVALDAFCATFNFVLDRIKTMAAKTCPKTVHGRTWSGSYGLGASVAIHQSMIQSTSQLDTGSAIVLRKSQKEVDEWLANNFDLDNKRGGKKNVDADAWRSGHNYGSSLNVAAIAQGM